MVFVLYYIKNIIELENRKLGIKSECLNICIYFKCVMWSNDMYIL